MKIRISTAEEARSPAPASPAAAERRKKINPSDLLLFCFRTKGRVCVCVCVCGARILAQPLLSSWHLHPHHKRDQVSEIRKE